MMLEEMRSSVVLVQPSAIHMDEVPVSSDRLPRMLDRFTRLNPEKEWLLEAPLSDAISDQSIAQLYGGHIHTLYVGRSILMVLSPLKRMEFGPSENYCNALHYSRSIHSLST